MLFGLVGVSVLLLADSFRRAAAWTTRLGIGVFLVVYSGYDAVAGISTGSRCGRRATARPRSRTKQDSYNPARRS